MKFLALQNLAISGVLFLATASFFPFLFGTGCGKPEAPERIIISKGGGFAPKTIFVLNARTPDAPVVFSRSSPSVTTNVVVSPDQLLLVATRVHKEFARFEVINNRFPTGWDGIWYYIDIYYNASERLFMIPNQGLRESEKQRHKMLIDWACLQLSTNQTRSSALDEK